MSVNIIAYQADFGACHGYRLFWPMHQLMRMYPTKYKVDITYEMKKKDLLEADLIIMQRQVRGKSFNNAIAAREHKGTRFVYEADDWFIDLPDWNPHKKFFDDEIVQKNLPIFLEEADAIFVSTEWLRKKYSEYNRRVYVLPNSIFPPSTIVRPRNNKTPVVGWVGSDTHKDDFAKVIPALDQIQADGSALIKLFSNKTYRGDHVYRVKWMEWADYYHALALLDLDVCLAPLAPHDFNMGKSNIRWLECAMAGTPLIASNYGPFRCIEHERTGLLVDDDKDWLPSIRRLLSDREFAETLVANAREEVLARYNIEKNAELWRKAIDGVMHRQPKKTRVGKYRVKTSGLQMIRPVTS